MALTSFKASTQGYKEKEIAEIGQARRTKVDSSGMGRRPGVGRKRQMQELSLKSIELDLPDGRQLRFRRSVGR